jgi:hypothetical protein
MFVSNNKVIQNLPNLISCIGDIPEELKVISTKFGNKLNVYNFGYQTGNPLILPFNLEIDAIVYGNVTLSSTVINTNEFTIVNENVNKLTISGTGVTLLWYRYGNVNPGTFDVIMQYAIQQNNYILIDALLHSLSIEEAVSFVLQNPVVQEQFKKGLDWQFNRLGFTDFLAYINNGKYDARKVALFLTIASYVFPCVFSYTNIPQFSGKPLQVFVQYLEYINEFGQVITSEISELFSDVSYLSEQIDQEQLEISVLFAENSILSSEVSYLSEQVENQTSEIETLSSEVSNIIQILSTIPLSPGFIHKLIAEKTLQIIKEEVKTLKLLTHFIHKVSGLMSINTSEYDSIVSEILSDYTNFSSEEVSEVYAITGIPSDKLNHSLKKILEISSEILQYIISSQSYTQSSITSESESSYDNSESVNSNNNSESVSSNNNSEIVSSDNVSNSSESNNTFETNNKGNGVG